MIKKDVVTRSEVRTIYSSEKQQRMKVYFELNEQYRQCLKPCKLQPPEIQVDCQKECEKVFEKYTEILKPRYESNPERIDMEVKNSEIFTKRKRNDRKGMFFDIAGISFREMLGLDSPVDP